MSTTKPESRAEKLAVGFVEAADILGISERTLRQEYRNWGLPHVRLNTRTMFPVDGLRRWLEDNSIFGNGAA